MGTILKNPHNQSVYTDASDRVPAGAVVEVDGDRAKALKALGFESASKEDLAAYNESRNGTVPGESEGAFDGLRQLSADARSALSVATVAGPNSLVIGDDQAPHGPGTGTITSKQAVAANGDAEDRAAFGPNEAHQVGEVDPEQNPGAEVHNAQVKQSNAVEGLIAEITGEEASDDDDDGEGDAPAGDGDTPAGEDGDNT